MGIEHPLKKRFLMLQEQMEIAEKQNRPTLSFVIMMLGILKETHDEFLAQALKEGFTLDDPNVGAYEVNQYIAMKRLAERAGLPTEGYDMEIKRVKIRVFGEENYHRFFETT